jgi:chemotaxis protein MotB
MKKNNLLITLLVAIFANFHLLYSKPFYSQTEYDNLFYQNYALEIELQLLKEDKQGDINILHEKINQLEKKVAEYNTKLNDQKVEKNIEIENLKSAMAKVEKKSQEDDRLSKLRIKDLEKQLDSLKGRLGDREKELMNELGDQEDKYLKEISSLKNTLSEERKKNAEVIASLNDQLLQWKKILDSQSKQLSEIENQAKAMEEGLKKEISEGNLRIKRLKDRLVINIDDKVLFDSGSASLKPEVRQTLEVIADILARNDKSGIIIEGHTDNVPIRTYRFRDNWQLSTERALSVVEFILNRTKLNPTRISVQGFGEYKPVAPNDTKENKQLNRRVDIVIIPDK